MPSLRDIRRRIRSIRNTAKITKAMELVAASRLRRAQMRVTAARPYAEAMRALMAELGGLSPSGGPAESAREARAQRLDHIFEPDPQSILEQLLPRYIEVQIYQAILETAASFFSAQMVAMRNATDNANDLVQDLSLTYNKVRQANITREVTEIASAAEAMAAERRR